MKNNNKGFTLIELMVVVSIIGILASIAIPKFTGLINKAKEGATKGSLASVRTSLQVYYGDNEGWFPADTLACLTYNAKYLNAIPVARMPGTVPPHQEIDTVVDTLVVGDVGGWNYANKITNAATWGNFVVSCTHEDNPGQETPGIQREHIWSVF